jgi:transketolase
MTASLTSINTPPVSSTPLDLRSRQLRIKMVKMLEAAKRGHMASAFSLVEIMRVLYDDILKYDPDNPKWALRDRCILSKGHGALALYVLLADKGFFPEAELWNYCKEQGILGGHPEYGKVPGVEASTGSLGHGLSIGIGFALNARYLRSDHRTFVIMGDGECNEGAVWEAALTANKHKLSNLVVIVDYNKQQSYATTYEVLDLEPFAAKWQSFGFAVREADGHSIDELRNSLAQVPFEVGKPSVLICHTVKGRGVSFMENNLEWHHKNYPKEAEIEALIAELELDQ